MNDSFRDLIKDKKLTFLVGAGCSIDKPSSLPSGRDMMKSIVEFSCHEDFKDEIEILVNNDELRFEQLGEIFTDLLDNDLQCIDYFSECSHPNSIHFFLAKMIQKGHFVITTNFDSLIEHALVKIGIPNDQIIPIITKKEFEIYNNPDELFEKNLFPVYKIHGSPSDIIKNTSKNDLKQSLIITTRALSENKNGLNIFELEPYKQVAFNNLLKNRTLIVLGYSGSDDFDIIPTLLSIKDIKEIIWISHSDQKDPFVYKLDCIDNDDNLKRADKPIFKLKISLENTKIFKVEGNTKEILSEIDCYEEIDYDNEFTLNPIEWLNDHIKDPTVIEKIQMCYKIFEFNNFKKALECVEKLLDIAIREKDPYWQSVGFFNKGNILRSRGKFADALSYYDKSLSMINKIPKQKDHLTRVYMGKAQVLRDQGQLLASHKMLVNALELAEKSKNMLQKAQIYNSLGLIQMELGDITESEKNFERALTIFDKLNLLVAKAVVFLGKSIIYGNRGEYKEEYENLQTATRICKELNSKYYYSACLTQMGHNHFAKGIYETALKNYNKAYEIAVFMDNNQHQAELLGAIGRVLLRTEDISQSLEKFNESLQINETNEFLIGKAVNLEDIAHVHKKKGDFPIAIDYIKQALEINKEIGNYTKIFVNHLNLGHAYLLNGNPNNALNIYQVASNMLRKVDDQSIKTQYHIMVAQACIDLEMYEKAIKELKLAEEGGENLPSKINFIEINSCFGKIREKKGDHKKAIFYYKKSLDLARKYELSQEIAIHLNKLGLIYRILGELKKALEQYKEALQITRNLNDHYGEANVLYNIGYLKNENGEYEEALQDLLEARSLLVRHQIKVKELQNKIDREIEIVKGNIKVKK